MIAGQFPGPPWTLLQTGDPKKNPGGRRDFFIPLFPQI
mgnify:CR=1 FL=1